MGFATYIEPRPRSTLPDTPPELLTLDSSSVPSKPSEERASWNPRAPPSPPMSNYDPVKSRDTSTSSSTRGSEEALSRSESTFDQRTPRQQLPPLSTILASITRDPPLHSTYSDRSSSYTPSSSLDRPVGSSAYFPPSTTSSAFSQLRSFHDSRHQERPQIPPLSQVFSQTLEFQPRYEQRLDIRSDYTSSANRWPAPTPQDASRAYSPRDREPQLYQPTADRYPPVNVSGAGRDESRRTSYREQLTPSTPVNNSQVPPPSDVPDEVPPAKDALGPKIWAGTHYLPRFVRAAEVPGEGLCYFYDDGSHCKTVIDGEAVNAQWGVTKAGKPRKRLAIACMTCREKKIKCDPDYPRCLQCEKFGRVCKFKNAARGASATAPSTPPTEPVPPVPPVPPLSRTPTADLTRPRSLSNESSISPRTALRPASPDLLSSLPRKQPRVGYDHYSPIAGTASPMSVTPEIPRSAPSTISAPIATQSYSWRQPEPPTLPRIHEQVLSMPWEPPDARV